MHGVVQRGEVTPTRPPSRTSARFFTPGIPRLDALFTSMKRSRRRTAVLRCSRDGGATERWLELPVWMFDRTICLPMKIARDPRVDLVALLVLRALLAEATIHCHRILRLWARQGSRATRTRGMPMRRRSHCPANHHGQVHQPDLFALPDPTSFDRPVARWLALPEETRRTVTELMARLLLDHGRIDYRPTRAEAADDV